MSAVSARRLLRPVPLFTGLGLAAAVVLFFFDPNHSAFYPGCVFYRTTGLLCPGCGCLRALHQLLHGHVAAAFHCNPLLLVTLVAALGIFAANRMRPAVDPADSNGAKIGSNWPVWIFFYLGIVAVFWVARNLPGPAFDVLRP